MSERDDEQRKIREVMAYTGLGSEHQAKSYLKSRGWRPVETRPPVQASAPAIGDRRAIVLDGPRWPRAVKCEHCFFIGYVGDKDAYRHAETNLAGFSEVVFLTVDQVGEEWGKPEAFLKDVDQMATQGGGPILNPKDSHLYSAYRFYTARVEEHHEV